MQQTQRFETDDFKDGIVVARRNITGLFTLNEASKNLSFGTRDGIGPRYGTAPLPFQTHSQTVGANSGPYNFRTSEGAFSDLTSRLRHLALFAFNSRINTTTTQTVYVALNAVSSSRIKASILGSQTSTAKTSADTYGGYGSFSSGFPAVLSNTYFNNTFASNLSAGLDAYSDSVTFSQTNSLAFPSAVWRLTSTNGVTDVSKEVYHARTSFLTVTGGERSLSVLLAFISPSKAPVALGAGNDTPGDLCFSLTGNPNDYFYNTKLNSSSPRTFYLLQDASPAWISKYKMTFTSLTSFSRKISNDLLNKNASYSFTDTTTATLIGSGTTTDLDAVYVYDATMKHRSAYKYLGVASGGKPQMYIWRDDFQSYNRKAILGGASVYVDNKVELFDAAGLLHFIDNKATLDSSSSPSASGRYEENGAQVSSIWYRWPSYVDGTATVMPSSLMVLGAANTGLLRSNTTYEFTYSVYDLTTGYETNVGKPAKLRTGVADFVNLNLLQASLVSSQVRSPSWQNVFENPSNAFRDAFLANINFREYRIYYREVGTFEWLPALTIPQTEAWFTPEQGYWRLCTNPIALPPGGQPGGFNDYSPLPTADYIDTVSFANRVFWLSKSQLHFSLRNNPLAYPIRNAVACPNGEFLGIIPHAYPGQAEQGARLIIFGSKETYTARFIVGAEEQARVRIGPDDAATFPVDGTNFIVDVWTSITAFSGRAAVVGDGILYYWGPQGVFRDDGVAIPGKISDVLEPWIDTIYDANNTDKIHAIFNSNSDEAIWFYQPPAVGGTEQPSRAIVYHTKRQAWSRWEFNDLVIDNAQVVENTKWDATNDELAGTRIIVAVRDPGGTVSRPMFLDEVVFAGDMQSDSQYMVTTVTHTDATTRRLTFATGPASIASKTGLAVIAGWSKYTGDTSTNPDGVYTIIGNGANYIDITRQSASADIPAGSYNENEYFPVWIGSTAGIPVVLQSQYWAPGGMDFWGRWVYCHTSYQVDLVFDQPDTSYDIPVRYYSLSGTDYSTQTITISDNSRGNCQVLNSIPFTKDNASGQAIAYECVFTHYAGQWKLQYLGLDVAPQDKANIRFWEG